MIFSFSFNDFLEKVKVVSFTGFEGHASMSPIRNPWILKNKWLRGNSEIYILKEKESNVKIGDYLNGIKLSIWYLEPKDRFE